MARSTHHHDYKLFLDLLRELRQEQGITQIVLADRLRNTQTFISKIERGERRLDVVEFAEVSEALGLDPLAVFRRFLTSRSIKKLSEQPKLARQ
jgi:transcriptional regulator with XRE-family HTH domain